MKNAIGLVQWQVEQRENLRQRIQREYERKQMEAGRLELTVSNIRLDQIALAGTAEELRVQETMQNIQQLEDMVHAAADKGTESLVRDLTEARDALLTDEELDRLLADAAQGLVELVALAFKIPEQLLTSPSGLTVDHLCPSTRIGFEAVGLALGLVLEPLGLGPGLADDAIGLATLVVALALVWLLFANAYRDTTVVETLRGLSLIHISEPTRPY